MSGKGKVSSPPNRPTWTSLPPLRSAANAKRAVADAGSSDTVLFVDVNAFEQYYLPEVTDEDARASLEQLAGVGMSGTTEGEGEGRFTLRLVADQD